MSLDAIAALLGYSDQSSFGRAFKRWTGVPPQQFRRETRDGLRKPPAAPSRHGERLAAEQTGAGA
jgi:AraC-like DNA-binding protein